MGQLKLIYVLDEGPGLGGGRPVDPGYGVPLPPGLPSHPIAPGGPPPQIWPSPGHPSQGLPPIPVLPTHPIAPGGERPDQSLPAPELPPLPPGGAYFVAWIPGRGYVAIPVGDTPHPDQGLPLGPEPR